MGLAARAQIEDQRLAPAAGRISHADFVPIEKYAKVTIIEKAETAQGQRERLVFRIGGQGDFGPRPDPAFSSSGPSQAGWKIGCQAESLNSGRKIAGAEALLIVGREVGSARRSFASRRSESTARQRRNRVRLPALCPAKRSFPSDGFPTPHPADRPTYRAGKRIEENAIQGCRCPLLANILRAWCPLRCKEHF